MVNLMPKETDIFRDVDNPLAYVPDKDAPPQPQTNLVRIKLETPIDHMHLHGQIDSDQKIAADTFRRHCEQTRIGGRVSDPSRPAATKGSISDPMEALRLDSLRELRIAHEIIGEADYELLWEAVVVGRSIADLAARTARRGTRQCKDEALFLGRCIKRALGQLVLRDWGVPVKKGKNEKPNRRFLRSFGSLNTDLVPDDC